MLGSPEHPRLTALSVEKKVASLVLRLNGLGMLVLHVALELEIQLPAEAVELYERGADFPAEGFQLHVVVGLLASDALGIGREAAISPDGRHIIGFEDGLVEPSDYARAEDSADSVDAGEEFHPERMVHAPEVKPLAELDFDTQHMIIKPQQVIDFRGYRLDELGKRHVDGLSRGSQMGLTGIMARSLAVSLKFSMAHNLVMGLIRLLARMF